MNILIMSFSFLQGTSTIDRFSLRQDLHFSHCSGLKLQYGKVSHPKFIVIISSFAILEVAYSRKLEKVHANLNPELERPYKLS